MNLLFPRERKPKKMNKKQVAFVEAKSAEIKDSARGKRLARKLGL